MGIGVGGATSLLYDQLEGQNQEKQQSSVATSYDLGMEAQGVILSAETLPTTRARLRERKETEVYHVTLSRHSERLILQVRQAFPT